jgi:hypothetical protein
MVELSGGLDGEVNFGGYFGAMREKNNSSIFPLYYKF